MGETYAELQKLSIEELVQKYDRAARSTQDNQLFLSQEIARRHAEKQTEQMMRINEQMRIMTIIITFATIISTIAVIVSLLR